jgi:hypothetical protein
LKSEKDFVIINIEKNLTSEVIMYSKGTNTINLEINSDDINDDFRPMVIDILKSNNISVDFDEDDTTFSDFEVEVDFWLDPPCRGTRGEYGVQLEPDYPASICDLYVYLELI